VAASALSDESAKCSRGLTEVCAGTRLLPLVSVLPAMLVHHLLLVTTDHLMAAGFLQTVRRAVVAFLAMVFGIGLLAGGLLGFFLGRAVGRRG
jgi:type IV secretory pathway TrbL component